MNKKNFKRSNIMGFKHLTLPILLAVIMFYTLNAKPSFYILGQLCGTIFFAQCFILLHELGHRSMFKSSLLNTFFGHIASLFVFIPYYNWLEIHDLHHKWTGYRDKDPTTEKTFDDRLSGGQVGLINFCWKFFIPLFTLGYRFGIYWKAEKLKRHLPRPQYLRCLVSMFSYVLIYIFLFFYFGDSIIKLLPAIFISMSITDIISLSQHSHIRMLNSEGKDVKPLRYLDQIKFSRSLIFPSFISNYLLMNVNFHEAHHAYPGLPCYHLPKMEIENVNSYTFWPWIKTVKNIPGVDFVFKSDPNRTTF
ncbi:MAG: omega-6 fatty acid desaturase (delta-12 desaturase) [Thermoproteota archaeon]|jgi:omega-6 fatty acid desaturase (delta-12 desaturase)